MSLTTCPDCGKQMSTRARSCPNCGRPIPQPARTAVRAVMAVLLIVAVIVLAIFIHNAAQMAGELGG